MLKFSSRYSSLAFITIEIIIIKFMIYFCEKSEIKIIDDKLLWFIELTMKTIFSSIFSLFELFDFIII